MVEGISDLLGKTFPMVPISATLPEDRQWTESC